MAHRREINRGKTKTIYEGTKLGTVHVVSRDDITAGDGQRKDLIPGKGHLSTVTTANMFMLLAAHGIPTHFMSMINGNTFKAKQVDMIPLECVARRLAVGSFLDRQPSFKSDPPHRFEAIVTELFYKSDADNDPIVVPQSNGELWIHDAHKPITDATHKGMLSPVAYHVPPESYNGTQLELIEQLLKITERVFEILEQAWRQMANANLVDLKIEFGVTSDGELIVADVIDADSWRLWPDGDPNQAWDKDYYRQHADASRIEATLHKYNEVAKASNVVATYRDMTS